jgi:hypothetical protein
MDYRGASVAGIWVGVTALSALFLYFEFIADVILALVIAAIILTVYIVRLRPEGAVEMEKIVSQLETMSNRLSTLEGNVENISRLLEE